MNEVMELISKILLESREDEAALYNISEEAGELEKQYTDAVTRASTVLAELSNYNSARTSEVTGVRYTRDPEKVRAYLASVSQAVRTVAQPGPADVQQLDAFSRTTNDTSPNATVKNYTVPPTGAHNTNGVKHEAADPQPTMSASMSSRQVQSKIPKQLPAIDLDGPRRPASTSFNLDIWSMYESTCVNNANSGPPNWVAACSIIHAIQHRTCCKWSTTCSEAEHLHHNFATATDDYEYQND